MAICRDCDGIRNKRWADSNKSRKSAVDKKRREANRDRLRELDKIWRMNNPASIKSRNARRRATKLQRTVPWVDKWKIKQIYLNCPEGMHVDHIVPLRGKNVSGLHVPWNLQYLTPEENMKKGNRYVG